MNNLMKKNKTALKFLVLSPVAALLMGNQSCEQAPQRAPLKKIVELKGIQSPAVRIPGVVDFDLQYVLNQQLYGVLAENGSFAFKLLDPVGPTSIESSINRSLSSSDSQLFARARRSSGSVNLDSHWSTRASCLVNLPMANIGGAVHSFEMVGGGGLNIGFVPGGNLGGGVVGDVDVQIEFAQMDFSMLAARPLTNSVMSAVNVTSQQTKTQLGLGINLGYFRLGPSFYYKTPLSTVTKNALIKAVNGIREGLESEPWFTRVLANHESHLTIIGGRNVGLESGDQLAVYNETYYWKGTPCASQYVGGTTTHPIAFVEVESVGDEISLVRVTSSTDAPVIGAKVNLLKLFTPEKKSK